MLTKPRNRPAALLPFSLLLLAGCAASSEHGLRTIAVLGRGVVTAAPDQFLLKAGVEQVDPDVSKASATVADAGRRVIEAAKTFPIDETRTRTMRFSVKRVENRETDEFRGYRVHQSVHIYLQDVSKAEELTVAVLRAGANDVSIEFLAEKGKDEMVAEAKQLAVKDARRQAEMLAGELGERVGRALRIGQTEESWGDELGDSIFGYGQSQQSADWFDVTWIAPNQIEVEATVSVAFALADPAPR